MTNGIPTNCGNIDLASGANERLNKFRTNHIDNALQPDLLNGNITYFHNTICSWAYSVPLKFHWVITIQAKNKNYLLKEIAGINAKYENKGWDMFNSAVATTNPTVQDIIGCIFAQGVNVPGENVNVDFAGVTGDGSNRGFINAPIINGRSNFELLEIGFMETNRSFVDGVLRPWSIVVAHKGLIATENEKSIKADIIIHQLARNGDDQRSRIRKSFVYENCAPVFIASDTLDYSSSSDFPKVQAKFAYSQYYVTDSFSKPVASDTIIEPETIKGFETNLLKTGQLLA